MGPPGKRDEDWFTRVYAADYGQVVKYGQRRLADMEAAAELAQEVFVIAWRRRREVPDRSLPWLYGVARRLLANEWRARRAAPNVLPITDAGLLQKPGSSGADATVGVADLQAALATLTDLDQEILRLVGWEELTVAEAAQVLGCTRTTAAVRLHRARRRLNDAMSYRPGSPAQQPVLASPRKVM
ncbi:RNA polymerase sigma factor [Micromonospora sp. LZ34]|uniref:RNA polymerase sigma-70 factor, ECF subfamily n=1 Tax=Micromonospora rhizosphaerae TaxID=568872 RepID=A0A1C6TBK1_9ACTN|nr:sigma-70 family RNA polymerase sigma factor [Micromonospora rhizosphaerae]SCL39037.1 RNA polymerase sigma-70 factor, ECF subfamily [Micromonospora rhizosphaerae]